MMRKIDFDIIMIALPRWDAAYASTSYSLAKELSRTTRVFFVENPFTVKDVVTRIFSNQIRKRLRALLTGSNIYSNPESGYPNLVVITPLVILPINWLPKGNLYKLLLKFNDRLVRKSIRKSLEQFAISRFVFLNSFNPFYGWESVLLYNPILVIYQSVDDISHSTYVAKHGVSLEAEMIRRAEMTLVTSTELKRLKSSISNHVFLVPNAADIVNFNRAVMEKFLRPSELISVPIQTKIICYIGNICHRVDYTLLMDIAKHHNDKVLLLIGPITGDYCKTSGLLNFKNVILTGTKAVKDLPSYLQHSHCCIIPFVKNTLTRSIYPLKINEYLAAGKPVVTTNFSEDISTFSNVVSVCKTSLEFVQKITEVIETDSPVRVNERRKLASFNDWKSRADHIIELIQRSIYAK